MVSRSKNKPRTSLFTKAVYAVGAVGLLAVAAPFVAPFVMGPIAATVFSFTAAPILTSVGTSMLSAAATGFSAIKIKDTIQNTFQGTKKITRKIIAANKNRSPARQKAAPTKRAAPKRGLKASPKIRRNFARAFNIGLPANRLAPSTPLTIEKKAEGIINRRNLGQPSGPGKRR